MSAYSQQNGAQPPTQHVLTNLLPPDDPTLYRHFFYFHHDFSTWLATVKAAKPAAAAADLDNRAAALLRLRPGEHAQLAAVTTTVGEELRGIDRREQAHANMRAHYEMPPITRVLRQFEAERQDAVARGTAKLQALPPGIWRATQDFVNGDFRAKVKVK